MGQPLHKPSDSWLERKFPTEEIESPFFALERQKGVRAIHIDFQFANGNCLALPCSDIRKIEFEISKGISIMWMEETISILGRNLHELYHYLIKHRVNAIREDGGEAHEPDALVITEIKRDAETL